MIHLLIVAEIVYFAFHLGHAHSKYRHYRRMPWYRRIWVSVRYARIGKRL